MESGVIKNYLISEELHKQMSQVLIKYAKEVQRIEQKYSDKMVEYLKDNKRFLTSNITDNNEYTWKLLEDERNVE